ncbi:hypothetical protein F4824DRAFT_295619 [Ustulina deusta]|nr:hypothetical protein F4824DRAFT_295619 [Ustulina deusta]
MLCGVTVWGAWSPVLSSHPPDLLAWEITLAVTRISFVLGVAFFGPLLTLLSTLAYEQDTKKYRTTSKQNYIHTR